MILFGLPFARVVNSTAESCRNFDRHSALGIPAGFPYRPSVIGFLRCLGVLNVAIWFGSAFFFTFAAGPAVFSQDMKQVLGQGFPYYSGAIAQVLISRYFTLQQICAVIALIHIFAEQLYFGRTPRKRWLGLLLTMLALSLVGGFWLQPRLRELHTLRHAQNTKPEIREQATQTFRLWHGISQVVNLCVLGGLGFYVCRVAVPPNSTR
jgi:hypothetical protein